MSPAEVAAWMSALAAAASAVAAFLSLQSAKQQSRAAERNLQIGLFEPRAKIYDQVSFVESELFTHGAARPEYLRTIADFLQRSEQLFGARIKRLLNDLYDALIDWETANKTIQPGERPTMTDRLRAIRAIRNQLLKEMPLT